MASMRDVAQKANVSVATVSRVLNNNEIVSEPTRNLVLQSALELKYPLDKWENVPRLAKSVYVLARDESIASNDATPPISREFERQVWQGVRSTFQQYDIITSLQSSTMSTDEAIRYAEEIGISGLVLLGGIINQKFVHMLQKKGVPFVVVGAYLPLYETNCVMADVMHGIRLAVRHLVQNGRSCIGFVNGSNETSTSAIKLEGLRLELDLLGIPFKPKRVTSSHFFPEAGYKKTKELLAADPNLDAIIYADDVLAIGGGRALQEAGYRIPTDIAIIGFGNYEIGRFSTPPLTTVHYDIFEMGKTAARRLKMLVDDPDDQNWLIQVPTLLKVRQSSTIFK